MHLVKWLNDNQGFVMAMLTLIYVLTTVGIALLALRANRISQKNIETALRLERNRLRPYVVFNITTSAAHHVYATLKNIGLTAASNVCVKVTPRVEYVVGDNERRESALTSQKISFLAPADEVSDLLDATESFYQTYRSPVFQGDISYEDSTGFKYNEPFKIDLTYRASRTFIRERNVTDELRDLNEILASLTKYLSERRVN
ncbi:MAG TPA: hypothetical protein VEY09_16255 [Pyrinomonadaceae bacterium]|nr:hypothetical protein [Pyrinomonadaceae bacterium]